MSDNDEKSSSGSSIAASGVFRPVICARLAAVPVGYARKRGHDQYSCRVSPAKRWTNAAALEHSRKQNLAALWD